MQENNKLLNARTEKNDEWYTQYEDIEKEINHYTPQFENKTVYCNCDDYRWSNFFKYFKDNFNTLKLKKLISTNYNIGDGAYKAEYDGTNLIISKLNGNGDFRNEESLNILTQSDIIVTNPPYSLVKEFIPLLIKLNKQFLIIATQNAVSYKEIFPLLKNNQIKWGYNCVRWFITDENQLKEGSRSSWYTNLEIENTNKQITFKKQYSPELYPKYDNYDAIEVTRTKEIPDNYYGIMGVPITFLEKYNPEQFEIIDINPHFFLTIKQGNPKPKQLSLKSHNIKDPYARILIKRIQKNQEPVNDDNAQLNNFLDNKPNYDFLSN